MELVDTGDLKSPDLGRAGSSPALATKRLNDEDWRLSKMELHGAELLSCSRMDRAVGRFGELSAARIDCRC